MVASRTALVVGGITFPVGLILAIVGAAYYGDEYSTCSDAKVEVAVPWCKVGGTYEDKIYKSTGEAYPLAEIFVDKAGTNPHVALDVAAALPEFRFTCTGSADTLKCDILDDNCELYPELEDKFYNLADQGTAAQLEFFQKGGKKAIKVAQAKKWCQLPSTGAFEDNLYTPDSAGVALNPTTDIFVGPDLDNAVLMGDVASNSTHSGAAALPYTFTCKYSHATNRVSATVESCDILNDNCELKAELENKLWDAASGATKIPLVKAQFDGASDITVATRRLQTAVGGAFRKLDAALAALNKAKADALKNAADVADDACDADFAAMVAMCVIGGILMVVGLVFFVIWGKYSSDAESK